LIVNVFNMQRVSRFRRRPDQLVYGARIGGAATLGSLRARGVVVAPLRSSREMKEIELQWSLERISLKRLRGLPF
jgi:hypothetical protein